MFPCRMRIGLLRRGYSRTGGAEAYLKRFAQELAKRGHQPVLLTCKEWPKEDWRGEIVRIDTQSPAEFAKKCMERRPDYDLFFSMERVPGCDVFRAGDGVHKSWLERRARLDPAWKRWTYRLNPKHGDMLDLEKKLFSDEGVKRVIANSKMVRDEIIHYYDFPADRIDIVYNGLPFTTPSLPHDKNEIREQWKLPPTKTLALFVGSGWNRKGLRFAVRAINQFHEVDLVVAGRGEADEFKSPNVHFLGPVNDIASLYAACDLFILPTIYDPFSNACIEAAAAGLPVITTNANGFSEIITPGEHGEILSRPDAIDEIMQALRKWTSEEKRNEARPKILELASGFSIQRNVDETLAVIEACNRNSETKAD
ncbi:MAG: glycosyltransferase family 4 protein [Chthoniobacterales bacterium]